jgi:hypothetical protein
MGNEKPKLWWISPANLIIGFIAGAIAVFGFIDSRVAKIKEDPNFMQEVAKQVKPYIIFNEKGSILFDNGASKYIDVLEINVDEDRDVFKDFTIYVNFNKHFSYPPYLESLNGNGFAIKENRGKKHDWIYKLNQSSSIGQEYRFRLELIQ